MQMAFEALDAYIQDPKNQVDSKRIYVMGLSMGGYGTWDAIQRRPDFLLLQSLFVAEEINHSLQNLLIFPYGPGTEIRTL